MTKISTISVTLVCLLPLLDLVQSVAGLTDWDDIFCEKGCEPVYEKADGCCPDTSCRGETLGKSVYKSSSEYEVIQECPGASKNLKHMCKFLDYDVTSDLAMLLPVTSGRTTFFNKHCASCFNVTDYKIWSVNISCKSYVAFQNLPTRQDIFDMALSIPYCKVTITPPDTVSAKSCEYLFDILEEDSFPFGTENDIVKSMYPGGTSGSAGFPSRQFTEKAPLSIILNFNDDTEETNNVAEDKESSRNCSSTQWTHNLTGTCYDITCSPGKRLTGGRCLSVIDDGRGLIYRYLLPLVSVSTLSDKSCNNWTSLAESTKEMMLTIVKQLKTNSYKCEVSPRFVKPQNVQMDSDSNLTKYLEINLNVEFIVTETVSRDEYEEFILDVFGKHWNFSCGGDTIELSPRNLLLTDIIILKGFTPQTYEQINSDYLLVVYDETSYIPVTPFLVCPFVRLNESQYNKDNSTDCISIDDGRVELCGFQYDMDGNKDIRVCIKELTGSYDAIEDIPPTLTQFISIHAEVQMYLSFVCITLSLVCLLTTFIVYMVFPSLQSLPAKNNICLVFNLFWAQCFLQFGIKLTLDPTLCRVVGVLIHFFWLSAILSMNVCSYHMYSVFSYHKMAIMPRHSSTKRLIRYITYTYTTAGLIVTATIVSQYLSSGGLSIGYGERFCYLSSATLIGFAFALPLGIILLLNGVMFVLAVRSIAQTSRIEAEVLSRGRQNLHVYMKLSTLTGLFWIVGILAEALQVQALTYLSIVLNGSQGVFIFMACVCSRRVLRLIVNHKTRRSSSEKTKTTLSNTKSTSLQDAK